MKIYEELVKLNKILICGMNEDALQILRINFFDLDYEKIIGITDYNSDYKKKAYVNLDVINFEDISNLDIDCIIITNPLSNDYDLIKNKFLEINCKNPEIFYLCDMNTINKVSILNKGKYGKR